MASTQVTSVLLALKRILIVEDETLVAMNIEDVLTEEGCEVVGPASRLDVAIRLAREERIDAAVLDVTIRGGQVFPVAEILMDRGIPFVLASGYGDWALPERLKGQSRLTKPFSSEELLRSMRALFRPAAA